MNEDLISRSALLEKLGERARKYEYSECTELTIYEDMHEVKTAPAVDAVIPVRCADCEAWETKTAMSFLRDGVHVRCCPCSVLGRLMYDDDFATLYYFSSQEDYEFFIATGAGSYKDSDFEKYGAGWYLVYDIDYDYHTYTHILNYDNYVKEYEIELENWKRSNAEKMQHIKTNF